MKNLKKKNNKGFSLVELIVVVMIMAILAVALAPQVMKWVGNSRKSADVNTYESMVSSLQLALANETVYNDVKSSTVTVTIQSSGVTISPAITSTTTDDLNTELGRLLGTDYATKITTKTSSTYTIQLVNGAIVKPTTGVPTTALD